MDTPLIIVVDEDDASRAALCDALAARFAAHYRILAQTSTPECLTTLDRLDRDAPLALAIAVHHGAGSVDCTVFNRVHGLHSCARRLLVYPMVAGPSDAVLPPLALGQIDDYVVAPWGHPELTLYPLVTELLSGWVRTTDRPAFEAVKVVGEQWAPRSHELRDRFERNQVPFGFYPDDSAEGRRLLREADLDGSRLPVVVLWDGRSFVDPTLSELLEAVGGRTRPDRGVYDLAIVGCGPAGLAAAVYGSSEGLNIVVIEREAQGGQAGTSSMIRTILDSPAASAVMTSPGALLSRRGNSGPRSSTTRCVACASPGRIAFYPWWTVARRRAGRSCWRPGSRTAVWMCRVSRISSAPASSTARQWSRPRP